MATGAIGLNQALSDYYAEFTQYKIARSNLLSEIASYTGGTDPLIIRSNTGKEFWIIFVKNYTLKSYGTPGISYDIDITGTGLHLFFSVSMDISYIKNNCTNFSDTSNVLNNLVKFEFYGDGNATPTPTPATWMKIESVVQNKTVTRDDDISDIDYIDRAGFENLCWGIAYVPNAMSGV